MVQGIALQVLAEAARLTGQVPAGGSISTPWLEARHLSAARVVVISKGANVTVTFEGSPDDGATAYALASNVTGVGAVVELADLAIRLVATNAGTAAESVDAWLIVRR